MIADLSVITMRDGTKIAAMDAPMMTPVLGYRGRHFGATTFTRRDFWVSTGATKLIFANGRYLIASEDQMVCFIGTHNNRYRRVSELRLGDSLVGECAGTPTSVMLVATAPVKNIRLVNMVAKNPFVANGVVCR